MKSIFLIILLSLITCLNSAAFDSDPDIACNESFIQANFEKLFTYYMMNSGLSSTDFLKSNRKIEPRIIQRLYLTNDLYTESLFVGQSHQSPTFNSCVFKNALKDPSLLIIQNEYEFLDFEQKYDP
ncbi:MAG: hypothetical protein FWG20_00535 [Candidatus Cloacimonetes bacterium]|nr:hypothetical protein [Candidatus Cloacimonadota bacterium]